MERLWKVSEYVEDVEKGLGGICGAGNVYLHPSLAYEAAMELKRHNGGVESRNGSLKTRRHIQVFKPPIVSYFPFS